MDLLQILKLNQAKTKTIPFTEDGLSLQLRRFSIEESARYFQLAEVDQLTSTLYLLKTVVLDESGKPYFSDDDDEVIKGAVDEVLKPIIDAFWKFQNQPGKTLPK